MPKIHPVISLRTPKTPLPPWSEIASAPQRWGSAFCTAGRRGRSGGVQGPAVCMTPAQDTLAMA